MFIDWLNISQSHYLSDLPQFNSGKVASFSVDDNGELQLDWETEKYFCHDGSHDTRIMIRVCGSTVEVRGNIGAFNRPDNVFGYDFETTLIKLNQLLESLDLPPFTSGDSYFRKKRQKSKFDHDVELVWTGATVSRLDLTRNYETGSSRNALEYLHFLSGLKPTRMRTTVPGATDTVETVSHGETSKIRSNIIYNKAAEFKKHKAKQLNAKDTYYLKLYEYLEQSGVIRLEQRLRQRFLTRRGLRHLGSILQDSSELNEIFDLEASKIMTSVDISRINDLNRPALTTYHLWTQGFVAQTSRSTFYRHRREILEIVGVDIANPYPKDTTVVAFPNVRVIDLRTAQPPSFYQLPAVSAFFLKTA